MADTRADRRDMSLRQKLAIVEDAPPWGIASALTSLAALVICLIVIGPALASILLGTMDATPTLLMASWALGMALCAVFVIVRRRGSPENWQALKLGRGNMPLPMALLYGVGIALALDVALGLLSGRFLPNPAIFGIRDSVILAALLAVILQPVAETLVFQAILLPALRSRQGAWTGVAITTALMTLLHGLVFMAAVGEPYNALWHGVALPAGLGFLFCVMRVLAGSSGAVLLARAGAGLIFLLTALALGG